MKEKKMKKIILATVFLALCVSVITVVSMRNADACSCGDISVEREALLKDAIMVVKIKNKKIVPLYEDGSQSTGDYVYYDIDVIKKIKYKEDTVKRVASRINDISCGYKFEVGKMYLVYGRFGPSNKTDLYVSLCSNTKVVSPGSMKIADELIRINNAIQEKGGK